MDCVEDGRGGLGATFLREPKDGAEIVHDGLEASGGEPAAGLLVDRFPGREVPGQVTPGGAGTDEPTQRVKDVTLASPSLASVLRQETEIGSDELPLSVGDIAGA